MNRSFKCKTFTISLFTEENMRRFTLITVGLLMVNNAIGYTGKCGGRIYDSNFSLCCDGIINSKSSIRSRCCGTKTYDSGFSLCCNEVISQKTGRRPDCCGTKSYDSEYRLCCDGVLIIKSGKWPGCCGTKYYDGFFSLCCNGVINARSGIKPGCCGTKAYDSVFQRCCNGVICWGICLSANTTAKKYWFAITLYFTNKRFFQILMEFLCLVC